MHRLQTSVEYKISGDLPNQFSIFFYRRSSGTTQYAARFRFFSSEASIDYKTVLLFSHNLMTKRIGMQIIISVSSNSFGLPT